MKVTAYILKVFGTQINETKKKKGFCNGRKNCNWESMKWYFMATQIILSNALGK